GEADLVESLMREAGGTRVLDAGCGTGRVAIELARRGFSVVGLDSDTVMLDTARAKAPELSWVQAGFRCNEGDPGRSFGGRRRGRQRDDLPGAGHGAQRCPPTRGPVGTRRPDGFRFPAQHGSADACPLRPMRGRSRPGIGQPLVDLGPRTV